MLKFTLTHKKARDNAARALSQAPDGFVVTFSEPKRSLEQNNRMWAMLTDVSMSKPLDLKYTAEQWKAVMMNACGYEVQFLNSVDGIPFPAGFKSSKMSKAQMTELMDYIEAFGNQHGVKWSTPLLDKEQMGYDR